MQNIGNPGSDAPQRETEVSAEANRLKRLSAELLTLCEGMETRLSKILVPSPPQTQKTPKDKAAVKTELGELLHSVAVDLDKALMQLQAVLRRCEL